MAIIPCSECSKEISDKALSCPHCGAGLKTNQNKKTNNIALTIVLAAVALFFVYGLGSTLWERSNPKEDPTTTGLQKDLDEYNRIMKNPK